MSIPSHPPDLARRLAVIEAELHQLRRAGAPEPPAEVHEVVFSFAGSLTATASPRYHARRGWTLTAVVASLATAGSSTTTIEVRRNGASLGTVSLTSGAARAHGYFATAFAPLADYLTVAVTAAGTGAANLTVQVEFRPVT